MDNRTGIFANGIIWFGVAISVSEIEAGIGIGAMSSQQSLWIPLILGHLLGGILLFLIGYIGATLRQNAMQTTRTAFGNYGSKFFATLNLLQLIAWISVLNAQGAAALAGLNLPLSFPLTCIILAVLVALWVYVGLKRSSKITTLVMIVLSLLLLVLTFRLYGLNIAGLVPVLKSSQLSFWNIFEISIAMPISWLPVISDYTKDAESPVNATAVSTIAYTLASLWMYYIGVEIAGIGASNTAQAILMASLGVPGVIIMILSTVTTNFLAANSAGESAKAIYNRLNPKLCGVIVSGLSAVLAISGIMNHYISFLYVIASVFAPMASVLLVVFYYKEKSSSVVFWRWNLLAWFAGFVTYQAASFTDSIFLGPTLLAVIVSAILAFIPLLFRK